MAKLKTVLLAAAVAAAALMPLYGDPRSTPVTHPLWARMLLRAMDMTDAVRISDQASQVFATLTWRDSLSFRADRYMRGDGIRVVAEGAQRRVTAAEGVGEVVYAVAVVRGGDYRLRVRLAGGPSATPTAEITPFGGTAALKSFTLASPAVPGWVSAGATYLDPGTYATSLLLPPGVELEYVEVAPPCLNPVEPVGGWRPTAIVRTDDVAVTALKAVDREDELPPAGSPIEVRGEEFRIDDPFLAADVGPGQGPFDGMWLKAGKQGLRAIVFLNVPEPGLYTLSLYGLAGGGQSWVADGCRKAIVCPSSGPGGASWRVVMTSEFSAGRHSFTVSLAEGAAIERVRLERKKTSPADYVATIRRLGFDPGPDGPVTQDKAVDGMKFVRDRRAQLLASLCGDVLVQPPLPTLPQIASTSTSTADAAPPAAAPATVPQPQPPPPLPPDLGTQPPASPVRP